MLEWQRMQAKRPLIGGIIALSKCSQSAIEMMDF
jgi:hypothetical protein